MARDDAYDPEDDVDMDEDEEIRPRKDKGKGKANGQVSRKTSLPH
jgi:hypothetical protein